MEIPCHPPGCQPGVLGAGGWWVTAPPSQPSARRAAPSHQQGHPDVLREGFWAGTGAGSCEGAALWAPPLPPGMATFLHRTPTGHRWRCTCVATRWPWVRIKSEDPGGDAEEGVEAGTQKRRLRGGEGGPPGEDLGGGSDGTKRPGHCCPAWWWQVEPLTSPSPLLASPQLPSKLLSLPLLELQTPASS